jgi:glucosamine--fructose-6-phosphate aminotransferase (isomerizing)
VTCHDGTGHATVAQWEENIVDREEERPVGFAMEHEILQTIDLLAKHVEPVPSISGEVTIIGCGSSMNAANIAVALAHSRTRVMLASEYDPSLDAAEVIIAVSQSGETADVLDAVRRAKMKSRRIFALVNAPHTTLTRIADVVFTLGAGEERCVAATKSTTLQAVALARLLGCDIRRAALDGVRAAIDNRLHIRLMARDVANAEHLFFIGRSVWFAVAQEALKCKEVAYQHAESIPALELKHGPLALITAKVPVIALGSEDDARLHSTIHEIEARDGHVVRLFFTDDATGVFQALVTTQLLTFEIGRLRGTPIDHPRNLAKSVTVY